jgi:hypothetical protein
MTAHLIVISLLILMVNPLSIAAPNTQPNTVKVSIENHLSPHLSNPERRDQNEGIKVGEYQAEIWRYESFERGDLERKLCLAVRSLIFGRVLSNKGVKSIFNRHSSLREISLIFYRLETSVNPDLYGSYKQTQQTQITARLTLQRDRLFHLNLKLLDQSLKGAPCVTRAKEILSDVWISEKILERRESLKIAEVEVRARFPLPKRGKASSTD